MMMMELMMSVHHIRHILRKRQIIDDERFTQESLKAQYNSVESIGSDFRAPKAHKNIHISVSL